MSFEVCVDLTNPGQFFASCGLFELAARLEQSTTAHFADDRFVVESGSSLRELLARWTEAPLVPIDAEDPTASPMRIGEPFDLRLDWWKDDDSGGRDLKVWAGTMKSFRIAEAMLAALRDPSLHTERLFDVGRVVFDPKDPTKKVEPFYFDARRAPNAHSRDVGFSPNDLDLTTTAFPAVEALCLVGLQRFRPATTRRRLIFEYHAWRQPLSVAVASAVASGAVSFPHRRTFQFECWYRTGRKELKAFRPAVPVKQGE
ncbi:MAG: hypothetical protein IT378_03490 [Sandaracinaceae bacterium]|nr:hypothetical protein [Sandaracinaceae bacterium]